MSAALKSAPPEEIYTWGAGYTPPVDPEVFKRAWDFLEKKLKHTPSAAELVDAAKDKKHPLHGCFNWDVAEAARAHWIDQARGLIRHLRVTYTIGPVRDVPLRALFQVRVDGVRTYASAGITLGNADLREQVMALALRDLRSFTGKYMVFLTAIGADSQATALEAAIEAAVTDGEP